MGFNNLLATATSEREALPMIRRARGVGFGLFGYLEIAGSSLT